MALWAWFFRNRALFSFSKSFRWRIGKNLKLITLILKNRGDVFVIFDFRAIKTMKKQAVSMLYRGILGAEGWQLCEKHHPGTLQHLIAAGGERGVIIWQIIPEESMTLWARFFRNRAQRCPFLFATKRNKNIHEMYSLVGGRGLDGGLL